jgi:hypothetical protein
MWYIVSGFMRASDSKEFNKLEQIKIGKMRCIWD